MSGETCDVCNKPGMFECQNCREAVYCSRECQKKDWEEHRLYDCYHPDEMEDDHVMEELTLHNIRGVSNADIGREYLWHIRTGQKTEEEIQGEITNTYKRV